MPEPVKHVVVVGGDPCASGVAACIANSLHGTGTRVTLVDDESTVARAASTMPESTDFYRSLRVEDKAFIAAIGATFKLGTEHAGWVASAEPFKISYGAHGSPIWLLPFDQYYMRHRLEGGAAHFDDFSLPAAAISAGRFCPFVGNAGPLRIPYQYGLHVDSQRFSGAMLDFAITAGVEHVSDTGTGANLHPDNGFIESVSLRGGDTLGGDFFVDCSGRDGLLIGDALKVGYESYADTLPCDSRLALTIDNVVDFNAVTRVVAKSDGWSRRIQLVDRAEIQFFYNGSATTAEDAAIQLAGDLGADVSVVRVDEPIATGRRKDFWLGNCVAIGDSASAMEPLEDSGLSRAHRSVMRLMSLWPHSDFDQGLAAEYNRTTTRDFEFACDFASLFYTLADREDSDFWRQCRELRISDSLSERLNLFRSRGRVNRDAEDIVSHDRSVSAMIGLGCMPEDYDPLVDVTDRAQVDEGLDRLRNAISEQLEQMPMHKDFLAALR